MDNVYITLSSRMDWVTREGTAFVVVEQAGKETHRYTKTLPGMTDNKIMLVAALGALEWIPDDVRCVIRSANDLGAYSGQRVAGSANMDEKVRLISMLVAKRCKYKFEVLDADSIRKVTRLSRAEEKAIRQEARNSPTPPPSQWNGPESFATYEVPCPCGKPLKFEFWMFFRCDQTKTVQCPCGKKTERFYNAESGKFGK